MKRKNSVIAILVGALLGLAFLARPYASEQAGAEQRVEAFKQSLQESLKRMRQYE